MAGVGQTLQFVRYHKLQFVRQPKIPLRAVSVNNAAGLILSFKPGTGMVVQQQQIVSQPFEGPHTSFACTAQQRTQLPRIRDPPYLWHATKAKLPSQLPRTPFSPTERDTPTERQGGRMRSTQPTRTWCLWWSHSCCFNRRSRRRRRWC